MLYITAVPAILTGPMNVTLEYSDDLTATFNCTAFGGDGAMLVFTWSATDSLAGLNISSQMETLNPDNSTTSTITTNTLTPDDRDSMYTCVVVYNGSLDESMETATLDIGEIIYDITVNHTLICCALLTTVPAILTGPMDVTLEYSDDDLTATFNCTAFGGDGAMLDFTWLTNSPAGLDMSSQMETINPADNSTTSTITTNILTPDDRDSMYTCVVAYDGSSDESMETATLNIGERRMNREWLDSWDLCV